MSEVPPSGTPVRALAQEYDLAVLDLDGVVYVGSAAVPGAVEALASARSLGMALAFVTNNASRSPDAVAAHLGQLGIEAEAADVVTSAQAAARLMADLVPSGSLVYVIGGAGLEEALVAQGLRPCTRPDVDRELIRGVVQGYGPQMPWRQVIGGALLVKEGLPWVVSNTDLTVPTEFGPGPGNGTLVRLVAEFSGRSPVVAGKPQPPLFRETRARVGGQRPLVVGDRIDTDIEGAHAVGWDSLLVMTGVSTLKELAQLAPEYRPTYVGADLDVLLQVTTPCAPEHAVCHVGGWAAQVRDGSLRITGSGSLHHWWQAVANVAWGHLDRTGTPAAVPGARPGSVLL